MLESAFKTDGGQDKGFRAFEGNPPKGLEARAFTFGGTEGSMLGRRGWFNAVAKRFDAGEKGMI